MPVVNANRYPPHVTLADILAEAADRNSMARKDPIRRDWFVSMLRNGIANKYDNLRFLDENSRFDSAINREKLGRKIAEMEAAIFALTAH